MRRILLLFTVAAMMAAMLGLSASTALANDRDRDHRDRHDRDTFVVLDDDIDFIGRHDIGFIGRHDFFDVEEDEDDWACVDDEGNILFLVDGPTDCPEGTRAQLFLGDVEDDNDFDVVGRHDFFEEDHNDFDHIGRRGFFVD